MYLGGNLERVDFIQCDKRQSLLDPAPLEELLIYAFMLCDEVV
jgi:hypothetical protein